MKKLLPLGLITIFTLYSNINASSFANQKEFNYELNIKEPVNIEMLLKHTKANCNTQLKLLDEDENIIFSKQIHLNGPKKMVNNAAVKAGNYTIIYRTLSSGCDKVNFDFSITRISGSFEQEPNDEIDSATNIVASKWISGYLQQNKDEDYYTFSAPSKGILDLEFKHKKIKKSIYTKYQVSILDSDENLIVKYHIDSKLSKERRRYGLNKGDYYIKINKSTGGTGVEYRKYKIAYLFNENENTEILPNDDFSNATLINDGVSIFGSFNYMHNYSKADYFKYKAKKGKYSLLYEHKSFKYRTEIYILDNNQKLIKRINQKGLKEKEYIDFEILEDGPVYIKFFKSSLVNEAKNELLYTFGIIKEKAEKKATPTNKAENKKPSDTNNTSIEEVDFLNKVKQQKNKL